MRKSLIALMVAATVMSVCAGEAAKPVKKPGDKKAVEMDYGPALAATVGVGMDKNNIAYKGIVISLNKERTQNVLFDTELLRVTAAWTGGYLQWASRAFADNNNDYCKTEGEILFATSRLPGWSKNSERGDPRNPKDGPLPKDWAKYKGLYLNGDKVVLSYTVGAVPVLELFGVEDQDGETTFTRTIHLGASEKELELFAFETNDGEQPSFEVVNSIYLKNEKTDLRATIIDGPPGAKWMSDWDGPVTVLPSRYPIYLKLPALKAPTVFKIVIGKKAAIDGGKKFAAFQRNGACSDLPSLTHGGIARWTQKVETKGVLAGAVEPAPKVEEKTPDNAEPKKKKQPAPPFVMSPDAPYVIDTLTAPEDNPYKSWMRFTGLDFFADGRAAVCTWNGDVWIISGIDEKLEKLEWKRFATGLNNPMGVKIVEGVVHTIGRDQITKLNDLNNDGEADFYENINNDCQLTTNFHEMCFDLQTDKAGNFYFTKGSSIWAGEQRPTAHTGTFIKVSKDGSTFEVLCSGLRAPNGIGVGPEGELTCSDNQGNWLPSCPINLIKKDGYYGWVGHGQKAEEFKTPDKPLCWIPYSMDKSTSGQIWVEKTNAKWGPYAGRMLTTSYDCWLLSVFMDHIEGDVQGGVVKFPLKFASGMMRPRFNPVDGQLYIAGLRGWSSSASRDCALQRVRYTGKPVCMPLEAHLTKTGFEVVFTDKLDPESVADKQNSNAEWFNIVRTANYGSPDYNVSDPKKKGRETLEISDVKLKEDGKTVVVTIPNLKPVTNVILKFNLKSAMGATVKYDVAYTINRMP